MAGGAGRSDHSSQPAPSQLQLPTNLCIFMYLRDAKPRPPSRAIPAGVKIQCGGASAPTQLRLGAATAALPCSSGKRWHQLALSPEEAMESEAAPLSLVVRSASSGGRLCRPGPKEALQRCPAARAGTSWH